MMKKIFILTPKYLDYDEATKISLRKAKEELHDKFEFTALSRSGPTITVNRTYLFHNVKLRYESGKPFDFILWLDADVSFEPSDITTLVRFIESGKGHCVTGESFSRHPGFGAEAWSGSKEEGVIFESESEWEINKHHKIYACGLDFFMMSCEAAIKYWDSYRLPEFFSVSWQRHPTKGVWQNLGEDVDFCLKLQEIGFDIWLDTHVQLTHAGVTRFNYKKVRRSSRAVKKEEILEWK